MRAQVAGRSSLSLSLSPGRIEAQRQSGGAGCRGGSGCVGLLSHVAEEQGSCWRAGVGTHVWTLVLRPQELEVLREENLRLQQKVAASHRAAVSVFVVLVPSIRSLLQEAPAEGAGDQTGKIQALTVRNKKLEDFARTAQVGSPFACCDSLLWFG